LLLPTILVVGLLSISLAGVGVATSFVNVPIDTLLQRTTEDSKRGRVMSIISMGTTSAMPIGYGISGFLLEKVGSVPILFAIGSLTLFAAFACFRSPELMKAR
jgi:MFS family permease